MAELDNEDLFKLILNINNCGLSSVSKRKMKRICEYYGIDLYYDNGDIYIDEKTARLFNVLEPPKKTKIYFASIASKKVFKWRREHLQCVYEWWIMEKKCRRELPMPETFAF